jgi:ABC-2 type transport system ATP-binding protein
VAVKGIDFAVIAREIFGLVGLNRAGKSTIMRMLAGVLRPDAGEISLAAIDVLADPERARPYLSYMPQRFGIYENLTVDEKIFFCATRFGVSRAGRRARIPELLDAAGLVPFRRRLAGQLSGGMKQKLGLVCALICREADRASRNDWEWSHAPSIGQ